MQPWIAVNQLLTTNEAFFRVSNKGVSHAVTKRKGRARDLSGRLFVGNPRSAPTGNQAMGGSA
jgi:hypothetical protein